MTLIHAQQLILSHFLFSSIDFKVTHIQVTVQTHFPLLFFLLDPPSLSVLMSPSSPFTHFIISLFFIMSISLSTSCLCTLFSVWPTMALEMAKGKKKRWNKCNKMSWKKMLQKYSCKFKPMGSYGGGGGIFFVHLTSKWYLKLLATSMSW